MTYWKEWAKCAGMRALKTFGQVAVAAFGTGQTGLVELDIIGILSLALAGALCSLFTSLAGLPELKEPTHPNQVEKPVETIPDD